MTICGALFHIAYWDKFNINGLAFISITDVLKSSIYPIFTILFSVIYNLTIQNLILPSTAEGGIKPLFKKGASNMQLLLFYSLLTIIVTVIFYLTKTTKEPINFLIYAGINGIFASIFLINNKFLIGQFTSERMRRLAIDLIVFIPIVSFYTGKYKSELIYQNIEYKYSIVPNKISNSPNSGSDTLKFIGNTEKHFVFTDLQNTKAIFIKADNIDTLIFYNKK